MFRCPEHSLPVLFEAIPEPDDESNRDESGDDVSGLRPVGQAMKKKRIVFAETCVGFRESLLSDE